MRAPDFNVLRFCSYDEEQVSDLFRDMLSIDGSHGQGDRFLAKFLEMLDLRSNFPDLNRARVRREEYTGFSRDGRAGFLDILLSTPEFGIGIENKPFALEQPDQLDRYWNWLHGEFPGFLLVYFNGTGRPPGTLGAERSSDKGRFREWAYVGDGESVSRWLQLCEEACDSDRVRWGLNQLREHFKTPEGRSMMDPESREAVEYVLADPGRLDLALTIGQGYDGLRQRIWKSFLGKIAGAVLAKLAPLWRVDVQPQVPEIKLRRSSWHDNRFLFLGQIVREKQTYFGLHYEDAGNAQCDALKAAMEGTLGASRAPDAYWLWARLPDMRDWRDWSDRRTLLDMHNPETKIEYWTDSLRMARAVESGEYPSAT